MENNKLKTILILDDSYVVREPLKDIFRNRNYNVLKSSTASEVLNLINSNQIDLMLN